MTSSALLAELLEQERKLVFRQFDNDAAITLGALIVEIGRARSLPITIHITRSGQQLFHAALSGTSADNDHWVQRKIAVVMRFAHSSYYMGRSCVENGVVFHEKYLLDPASFAISVAGLVVVAAIACFTPARAATRIDPAEALRREQ